MKETNEGRIVPTSRKQWRHWPWLWLWLLLIACVLLFVIGQLAWAASPELPDNVIASIDQEDVELERFASEVRLKEVRNVLAGRAGAPVNEPALFNRMIGDRLILQRAKAAGIRVEQSEAIVEIGAILGRLRLNEEQMRRALATRDLSWEYFERSVEEHETLSLYVDQFVLVDIPASERKEQLDSWMETQFESAEMQFDQDFLNRINAVDFPAMPKG